MQNKVKQIWNTAGTVLVSLMVILAVLLWGCRLLGMKAFVVQSGSMEPAYHVGSLVYVRPVDASKLQVGDVITFELGGGLLGTHRIVKIQNVEHNLSFITKGDANNDTDSVPVQPENIVGRVNFTIPYLGYLAAYIQQPPGVYVMISVVSTILLLTIIPDMIFPEEQSKKKKKRKKKRKRRKKRKGTR